MEKTNLTAAATPRRTSRRGLLRRLGRAALWLLAGLVALPLVLTPLYAVVDPVSVPMLSRMLTGQRVVREWRGIDALSDRLKAAVVMSEDGGFCRHAGVDFAALRTEIDNLLAGRPFRGASTLTMQVARNLFLGNDPSFLRKGLEVPLALYVDLVLSKRRILEIYLNIAEWGPDGEFGAAAGARAAFGVEAGALSWGRASLLATALPNPRLRRAASPSRGLRRVAAIVETRARQYGQRAACVTESGRLSL
ncbi:transglycosylase domain-containing protein [Devosia sp.]|uniref:transglycosylase domain-containing protein n=1 Tax=Devosia sp. TaxID=1871048 RepID=UPI002F027F54